MDDPGPTIVLVHGAFADASGFRGLYDELRGEGVMIIAPPNPLRGPTGGDGENLKGRVGLPRPLGRAPRRGGDDYRPAEPAPRADRRRRRVPQGRGRGDRRPGPA